MPRIIIGACPDADRPPTPPSSCSVEADDPDWSKLVVRSDEVPTISPEFLASERRGMSPDLYAQEYECAFGKAGAALFTLDRINALFGEAS